MVKSAVAFVFRGLITVTVTVPAEATSAAAIAATRRVESPGVWVVGRGEPFQRTTAPSAKPLPCTCRLKAGLPAVVVPGLKLVIRGGGSVRGVSATLTSSTTIGGSL